MVFQENELGLRVEIDDNLNNLQRINLLYPVCVVSAWYAIQSNLSIDPVLNQRNIKDHELRKQIVDSARLFDPLSSEGERMHNILVADFMLKTRFREPLTLVSHYQAKNLPIEIYLYASDPSSKHPDFIGEPPWWNREKSGIWPKPDTLAVGLFKNGETGVIVAEPVDKPIYTFDLEKFTLLYSLSLFVTDIRANPYQFRKPDEDSSGPEMRGPRL